MIRIEPKPWTARLFCKHAHIVFVRNVHGDEINHVGGKRSVWRCCFCGSTKYEAELYRPKENMLYKLL